MGQKGSVLAQILIVTAVIGVSTVALLELSKTMNFTNKSVVTKQRVIEIGKEMRSILADINACTVAKDSGWSFIATVDSANTPVGGYQINGVYDDIQIQNIQKGVYQVNFDPSGAVQGDSFTPSANPGRTYVVMVTFRHSTDNNKLLGKQIIQIQEFANPNNPTQMLCTSFETNGIIDSVRSFCESFGGSFNEATSRCEFRRVQGGVANGTHYIQPGPFQSVILNSACENLGSNLSGTTCQGINLPGTIETEKLHLNRLDYSMTGNGQGGNGLRSGFINHSCSGVSVATGFAEAGGLNCRTVECTAPNGATSSWAPSLNSNNIRCSCRLDRAHASPSEYVACGQIWYSSSNCGGNLDVDDGCGTGTSCTLQPVPKICDNRENYYTNQTFRERHYNYCGRMCRGTSPAYTGYGMCCNGTQTATCRNPGGCTPSVLTRDCSPNSTSCP